MIRGPRLSCHFVRESVAGLRSFLLEQTAAGGDKAVLQYVTGLLSGNVGFLFNERVINIPAQVRLVDFLIRSLMSHFRSLCPC